MTLSPSASNAPAYNITPWDSEGALAGSSSQTSPLDEFRSQSLSPSSPESFTNHRLLSTPDSGTLSRSVDEISPMFVEMAGHQYKLTEVQITNLRVLHQVCSGILSIILFLIHLSSRL
jgi:hypothetical protein